jgi:hypothetical protein
MSEETLLTPDQPAQPPPAVERRAFPRYPAGVVVRCWPAALAKKDGFTALLEDVSAGGVGLVLRYHFIRGTLLVLDLGDLTGDGPAPLLARVVRIVPRPGGRWLHGCVLRQPLSARQLRACGVEAASSPLAPASGARGRG